MPDSEIEMSTVLVVGTGWWALNTVRALDRLGYTVIACEDGNPQSTARYSRHANDVWVHPPIGEDSDLFIDALEDFLETHPEVDCVFPVGDVDLAPCAQHYARLSKKARMIMVDPALVHLCGDKASLLDRALEAGIPTRDFEVVADCESLFAVAHQVGYPLVIRATDSQERLFDRKATIVDSEHALTMMFERWPEPHTSLLVQSYARGPRYNIYLAAERGRLVAAVQVAILRTSEFDGTGNAVEGITVSLDPQLLDYAAKLVTCIGLHGLGCAQFLVDPDTGDVCLIEINPRLGANFAVVEAAGVDLVAIAMALGQGDKQPPDLGDQLGSYTEGVHYALTSLDLKSLKESYIKGKIGMRQAIVWFAKTIKLALQADLHLTWRWRDPMPTLVLCSRPIFRFLKKVD